MSGLLEPPALPPLGTLETRSASLSEQAYARLRELILDRRIAAGSLLLEGKIADELGISRTPMREALGRLAGEGLLVRRDARSYSVRTVGKFVGTASTECNGGNDPSPIWNSSCGAPRSRRRCSPRLWAGIDSSETSTVARVQTICPPWATAITRAARFTALPK